MILIPDQRKINEMSPEEQRQLLEALIEDNDPASFCVVDEDGNPVLPDEFFKKGRRQRRPNKLRKGVYFTCRQLGDKIGRGEDTIRKEFAKEKSGVVKRTFSGRNRKAYTVMLISKVAAKRHYPDLDI
jgi:hypothetical protein